MNIEDFLPKYPDIQRSEYDVLNPYSSFYKSIYRKNEFYENKLDRIEEFPKESGILLKHQKTIARYLSSHTPYNRLLLVHEMGTGKCVHPNTTVIINNKKKVIHKVWEKYKTSVEPDEEGEKGEKGEKGEWTTPSKTIYTESLKFEKGFCMGKIIKTPVKKLYRQYVKEPLIKLVLDDSILFMTARHKVLTDKGWKGGKDLQECNFVLSEDIELVGIKEISTIEYEGWVYDMEIDTHHNYVANGIITHNTCSAIGAIEQIKKERSSINGAIIIARGSGILDNFTNELLFRCTGGEYIPENYELLSPIEKIRRTRKKISSFYSLDTIQKFAKKIKNKTNSQIRTSYSNKIIVIDEVHNLRIQPDKKDTADIYKQYHRLLHNVDNCKVLLMSGTPMKDGVEEISSVMNLLIPKDKQLPTGTKFIKTFMDKKEGVYTLKDSKKPLLRQLFKGKVSFLRSMQSDVKKRYLGRVVPPLKHLIVDEDKMSDFQTEHYTKAYKKDTEGKHKGIYLNSREAALFVFPDGSYGSQGFKKYIKKGKNTFSLSNALRGKLEGKTQEEILNNIGKYSSKYKAVLKQIISKKDRNCFVYSSSVSGSGAILFSLLLKLLGYSRARGNERTQRARYAIFTGETSSRNELKTLMNMFNRPDNMQGKYIQVIIGSRTVSEGYSFKNIQFEAILTPHFNYSETSQAIARGVRLNSHNDLIKAGIKPRVDIMQCVSIPNNNTRSIDLVMYKMSEDKDISIHQILRLIMETAFDCALNYLRNRAVNGVKGSRDCDYMDCDYKCKGVSTAIVPKNKIDYSTYELYYTNPDFSPLYKKIEKLLRKNIKLSLDDIVKALKDEYSEDQVLNALDTLRKAEPGPEYDYIQFLDVYARNSVQKIMKELELLFQENFYLDLSTLYRHFNQYRKFEILTALDSIMNHNIAIKNRYGMTSYLKESNNIYFLVDNLSVTNDIYSEYYTQYPTISPESNLEKVYTFIKNNRLPGVIREICKTKTNRDFARLMKIISPTTQENLIEAALEAKDNGIDKNINVRRFVMEYFANYINKIDGLWTSSLLKEEGIIRCKEERKGKKWKNCSAQDISKMERGEEKKKEEIMGNRYGVVGLYNPENKKFCLIDMKKGKKGGDDSRKIQTGKNCSTWTLKELIGIIRRIKLSYPDSYYEDARKQELKRLIKSSKKSISKLDISESNIDDMKRILYWGNHNVGTLCREIRKWLGEKGLIVIDNQCGVQGKRKAKDKGGKKKRVYRIEVLKPDTKENRDRIKDLKIANIMNDCAKIEDYRYDIRKDTFYIAYLRSLTGFIIVRDGKIIWACMPKTYRQRKQIREEVMKELVKASGINTLELDETLPQSSFLRNRYKSYGFAREVDREGSKLLLGLNMYH